MKTTTRMKKTSKLKKTSELKMTYKMKTASKMPRLEYNFTSSLKTYIDINKTQVESVQLGKT